MPKPMPISRPVPASHGWAPGPRISPATCPSAQIWSGVSPNMRRHIRAKKFRARRTGPAIASYPSGSSSGRTCHSACTTAPYIQSPRPTAGRSASCIPDMAAPPEQAEVAAFLRDLAGSDPLETHISLVFVGTDTVWKLKKAVRLAFLDFTSVGSRRRFTLRELELNQPAAPELYRDAVPVVRRADGTLAFGERDDVEAIDWVLRMARVPPGDFLDEIAAAGRLNPVLLEALGDTV